VLETEIKKLDEKYEIGKCEPGKTPCRKEKEL